MLASLRVRRFGTTLPYVRHWKRVGFPAISFRELTCPVPGLFLLLGSVAGVQAFHVPGMYYHIL